MNINEKNEAFIQTAYFLFDICFGSHSCDQPSFQFPKLQDGVEKHNVYIYFSNQLVLPLRRLKATMKMAAMGNRDVRYQGYTHDEINDVGESFNDMLVELNRMAQQDLKRQATLQKTELNLLQAQINPHFLYNTLDSILWQAQVGNNEAVVNTVDALGNFFRTTLSKGSGWIRVHEEVESLGWISIIHSSRRSTISITSKRPLGARSRFLAASVPSVCCRLQCQKR